MKLIIVVALFGLALADRPQQAAERNARIISQDARVDENSYQYKYETENGIAGQEQGQEADGIQSQGSYQYYGDDGQLISVVYNAGANGFQPQGAHLPTPPPVPEEILKALEQNAADEARGIVDDGSYNPGKYGDSAAPAQQFGGAQQGFGSAQKQYRFQASAQSNFRNY